MKKLHIVIYSCVLLVVFGIGIGTGILIQQHSAQASVVSETSTPVQQHTTQTSTVSGTSTPEFQLVEQAWNIVSKNYVDRTATQPKTLAYGTIAGMVNSLGDSGMSVFLDPEQIKQEKEFMQGKLEGIGAYLQDKVVIALPLDGSPAQKAGLQPGDIILKVNGQPVTSAQDVLRLGSGAVGTSVTLTIQDTSGVIRNVTIVQGVTNLKDVTWQELPGTSIADLRIAYFNEGTARDLDTALTAIKAQGVTGIILDLRDNSGGPDAVGSASRFLKSGNVFEEKYLNGNISNFPVLSYVPKTSLPMVVLVNYNTAASAEVVAGALQVNGRAKLVGETTMGTGTFPDQFSLPDGSIIRVGDKEWLLPNGKSIWHVGLTPDKTVYLATGVSPLFPEAEKNMTLDQIKASGDQQLLSALNLLQQSLSQ